MADETQIQKLLAALDSEDIQIQLDAIIKLGALKSVEAIPKLIGLLNDKDQDNTLRMTVLTALGDIGHISALRAVLTIAREEDAPVAIVAELAGKKILDSAVEQGTSESAPPEPEPGIIPDLENTIPMKPVDVQPPPKPVAPAQAVDREPEYTGSMDLVDLDEFAAADDDETGSPAPDESGEDLTLNKGSKPLQPDELLEELSTSAKAEKDKQEEGESVQGGEGPAAEAQPELPPLMPGPSVAPGGLPSIRPQPTTPRRQSESETARRQREEASPEQPVQFSAYYPREVKPEEWQPLQAYVFRESAADRVLEDAEKQLGPLDRFRRIVEGARQLIREGDTITATPTLPGFQFNPPSVSVGFFEDWHRFDFKLRAKDAPLNLAANGLLTFTINGIIVADIPLSVFVTHEVTHSQAQPTPTQPMYDTVFASYSHKDTDVVLKVEAAAKTFGMTYLRDVITLRSGEDWSAGLERMIEDATIFQMFWSPPYAVSQHCQREWEYAVTLNKPTPNFIRPVYWLQPMPDPPAPLQHLHFTYQPDLIK